MPGGSRFMAQCCQLVLGKGRPLHIGRDRHPSGESGCGLGLAIVKRLVDLHQGTIEVDASGFSTGAAFHVRLPLHLPGDGLAETDRAKGASRAAA